MVSPSVVCVWFSFAVPKVCSCDSVWACSLSSSSSGKNETQCVVYLVFCLFFFLTCWGNASKFPSIIEWRFCPLGQTVARQNSIGTVLLPLTFQGMHFVDTKTARHTLTLLPRTKRNGSTITDNTRRTTLEFKQGQNVGLSRNTI